MKRLFCVVLITIILSALFCVPASAATVRMDMYDSFQAAYTALMEASAPYAAAYPYYTFCAAVSGDSIIYYLIRSDVSVMRAGYDSSTGNPRTYVRYGSYNSSTGVCSFDGTDSFVASWLDYSSSDFLYRLSPMFDIRFQFYIQNYSTSKFYEFDFNGKYASQSVLILPPSDKTALQPLIETANAITDDNYSVTSWNNFQTALTAANAVNNNVNATQEEVDQSVYSLQAAFNALEIEPPFVPAPEGTFVTSDMLSPLIDSIMANTAVILTIGSIIFGIIFGFKKIPWILKTFTKS